MKILPLKLNRGTDLRAEIEHALLAHQPQAAFVLAGIGSLSAVSLRFAARDDAIVFDEPLESSTPEP